MICPYCGNEEDKVLETRTNGEHNYIKRTRICVKCGNKFITHETIETKPLRIIKSDGRCELFDRSKLMRGMETACRKRPVAGETLEDTCDRIYYSVMNKNERNEVSSVTLGEMVCEELKKIDMVAYIRFASVYRQFESLEEFKKLIDEQ